MFDDDLSQELMEHSWAIYCFKESKMQVWNSIFITAHNTRNNSYSVEWKQPVSTRQKLYHRVFEKRKDASGLGRGAGLDSMAKANM